jgi:hypothetical protein
MRLISWICVGFSLGVVLPSWAQDGWQTVRVTNDLTADSNLNVDASYVVWERNVGSSTEIFLFDGAITQQITPSNNRPDSYPSISAGRIVWSGQDLSWLQRVYQYDMSTRQTTILSDPSWNANSGVTCGENVAWLQQVRSGDYPYGVFLKHGENPTIQLSSADPSYLKVTDAVVAWQEYIPGSSPRQYQVRVYDIASGLLYQVPTPQPSGLAASGRGVVWSASDGADEEIFYYDPVAGKIQLTNNATSDEYPDISGRNIVWQTFDGPDYDVMFRNLDSPSSQYFTNDAVNDVTPKISGASVVWAHEDWSAGGQEILHRDLSTGVTTKLSNTPYWDRSPCVSGWTVAWLADTSNYSSDVFYSVRTGSTPRAPFTPNTVNPDGSFVFNIDIPNGGLGHSAPVYLDPAVAIGYEYEATGLNFATVLLPPVGDDLFSLWLWDPDSSAYVFAAELTAGATYDFGPGGVARFRILGIEEDAALNPLDTLAFPTGVTFVSAGAANVTMIALVPEPSSLALLLGAFAAALAFMFRRE